jgi:hypothetical protein
VCPDCCCVGLGPCAPAPSPPDDDADPPLTAEQAQANADSFSRLLGMPVTAAEVVEYDREWRRRHGRPVPDAFRLDVDDDP